MPGVSIHAPAIVQRLRRIAPQLVAVEGQVSTCGTAPCRSKGPNLRGGVRNPQRCPLQTDLISGSVGVARM